MSLSKLNLFLGFAGLIFLNGFILCMADVADRYYDFVIQESTFTRLCNSKTTLTVNGSFPGPTLTARKGDTIYVNVHNQGNYGITIHWHGVNQPRNPWSDGPEYITQCPIQPGKNFTYEITFSTEEGTLWWHAHSGWTRASIHGAIVVLPAQGATYPFPKPDGEQTILIASWFKGDLETLVKVAEAKGDEAPISDAFTINGQPGDLYECSNATTYHMPVEQGKTYLLRIINAAMNVEQFFGIANHTLTLVGQDGAYVKPITTNYIMITPGQTMDVLVTTNQTSGYYYMVSTPFSDGLDVPFDKTTTTAILQYTNATSRPLSIPFPILPRYNDGEAVLRFTTSIRGLETNRKIATIPTKIDQHIHITMSVNLMPMSDPTHGNPYKLTASLNNITFVSPKISILEAYYRNISNVFESDFPDQPPYTFDFTGKDAQFKNFLSENGTKIRMINYGEAVEIVFQGTNILAGENHPMHLHGYGFYLVGSGLGNFNNETDPKSYNLVDPPLVSTAPVPRNGWVAVRFIADNPGVWFIHCHLERHAAWGMETVLIVKNGLTKETSIRDPPATMPACL